MLDVATIAALAGDDEFIPTQLSGCVLWLSDDSRLVALAQPSVTAPDDLTNAAWAKTRSTATHGQADPDGGTSADLLREDATAGATHVVTQTFGSFVAGVPATMSVGLKAKERSWLRLQLGGGSAYVNSATGAVGTLSGATVAPYAHPAGYYDFAVTVANPSSGAASIGLATADGVDSYNGDNASGAYVYNVRCTQNRMSQWTDRGTAGNHFVQATMASQAAWRPTGGPLGRPVIVGDGTDDHFSNATENTVAGYTIFAVAKVASIAGQRALWSNRHLVAPGGGTVVFLGTQAATGKIFCFMNTASIPSLLTSNALAADEWGVVELAVDGTGRSLSLNGTLTDDAANTTTTRIPSGYLWRDSGAYTNGQLAAVAMWTRRLSVGERSTVRQYFGRRFGIAVTP